MIVIYDSIDRVVTAVTGGSVKSVEGSGLVPASTTALPVERVDFTLEEETEEETEEEAEEAADELTLVLECVKV